jgi:hypothetical protein
MSTTTYAEVAEAVRALIATYTHALDDGRTDDLVACFVRDGSCEFPGMGNVEGHDALRSAFAQWKPRRPQRHLVFNTLLTEWSDDDAAAISDVVFLLQGGTGWVIQVVGRYQDSFHCEDGAWRFSRRTAEFVPPPPSD